MAFTTRHVASDGTDTWANSTSSSTPCSWATMVANLAANDWVKLKTGTYDLSGGAVTLSAVGPWIIQGCDASWNFIPDAPATRPVLSNGSATTDMLTISGACAFLRDVVLLSTASSGSGDGLRATAVGHVVQRVTASGWRNFGIESTSNEGRLVECEAYNCNTANTSGVAGFRVGGVAVRCCSHDNPGSNTAGFTSYTSSALFLKCLADTNGGDGFSLVNRSNNALLMHCDSFNNAGNGFTSNSGSYTPTNVLLNCNAVGNGGYGYVTANAVETMILSYCFSYNNSSGRSSNGGLLIDESSSSTYSGIPYADVTTGYGTIPRDTVGGPLGNFTLDATAGEGAAGRAAAIGRLMQSQLYNQSYLTLPSRDIGCSQHTDPGGGGGGGVRNPLRGPLG